MDTHFEQHLPRSPRPELSLPGEHEQISTLHAEPKDRLGAPQTVSDTNDDDHEAGEKPAPTAASALNATVAENAATPASKRRGTLMTSAAIGVTLVAAAGVILISPYNKVLPLNLAGLMGTPPAQPGSTQHIAIPAPIAPAAKLARAPTPHVPPAPSRPVASQQPHADDLQEIVNLRPGSSTPETLSVDKPAKARQPAATVAPSASAAMNEASPAQPLVATAPLATSVVTPASVVQPVTTATPPPPTVTPPTDPVVVATVLQAAPMSTTQQVDVLNVVTELGTLLRNQRAENVQLREDLQQMRERLDTQLNDYARRLSLAEARGAISAAMGAGGPTANAPATGTPASITVFAPIPPAAVMAARTAKAAVLIPSASPLPASVQETPRRYRVQAASPGLAMLAEVDRTGDAGNLLQVSIGDDVPGFGKVKSIAQQGAAWVLTAERGTIR